MSSFRFIDLFAGVGGFHIAMSRLGGKCVFASEIDPSAAETYRINFGIDPLCDIREVDVSSIPQHDVLCAGFPCQAFSKAGKQQGFDDTRGTLFFEIKRILKHHRPKYIVLENVRNLASHDGGRTWKVISENLKELGYIITEKPLIVSPHQVGVPQLRERVFILGVHSSATKLRKLHFGIPPSHRNQTDGAIVLNGKADRRFAISNYEEYVLSAWDEFIQGVGRLKLGFPIWANEFGKDYDLSNLPTWKAGFVQKNRMLYSQNKVFIDKWLKKYNYLSEFVQTHTKFEWQAGEHIDTVWKGIIQFRPSGIRVKRPTEFPALVAMVHIPVVGWEKRRLTPREVANLQSFPENYIINSNAQQAYKQFGNAVNVKVVEFLAKQLFMQA
ncbi:DNA cytosine methyltransferase [Tenuifilum sp.]|uniref:DNA cytosine methyltransferase n=1 Tax=Tenuifilum sp. TaxID=2760880 RepID=UPI001B6A220B|nr:DNA cytosine methyltransferase [Bacteroidales bacterium]HOK60847.1 DNA cytosine methyltransferase [Tenuifilum sp.]MBP9029403.1 DNA cytosine methyltransferase [Bacteroidales bacterium]HOU74679.1 DNA cytosine methyltransferase [Tenuifilum sp.]HQE54014.1 DNA cytosine methyltransferase [Tenuifilum sp.]